MKSYITLMRPRHYLKNILIFAPIIFSGMFFDITLLSHTLVALLSFCLISSVVYIINDIQDVDLDRQHSTKCNRPIASGTVPVKGAIVLAIALLLASLSLNFAYNSDLLSWLFLLGYFCLNMLYSIFGLKHIPIVDISILVAGFLLRVLYGSAVTNIAISDWLYLTIIAISFYMGLGKRRNEMKKETKEGESSRKVLTYYTKEFLDKMMYVCLSLAIIFYSLWSVDSVTMTRHNNPYAIWTVPIVIILVMRYSLNVEGDSDGDPVEVIIKDKTLLIMGAFYALMMFLIIYGL